MIVVERLFLLVVEHVLVVQVVVIEIIVVKIVQLVDHILDLVVEQFLVIVALAHVERRASPTDGARDPSQRACAANDHALC